MRYDEAKIETGVRLDRVKITSHADVLRRLYKIQPNMSFQKSSLKRSLGEVVKKRAKF